MFFFFSKSVAKIRQDFRLCLFWSQKIIFAPVTTLVKDSDGNLITTVANCLKHLREHFSLLPQHSTTLADPTIQSAANTAAPSVACSTYPVIPDDVRATVTVVAKQPIVCVRSRLPFSFSQTDCLHLPAVCVVSPLLHSDWCGIQGTHSTSHASY